MSGSVGVLAELGSPIRVELPSLAAGVEGCGEQAGAEVRERDDESAAPATSDSIRCGWVRRRRGSGDQGVATVFACLALAGLIAVTLMIAQVGVVVVGRHRAQAAADLAALAAAGALERGADAGCAEAKEIGRRMRVPIQDCVVVQWDVTVSVIWNIPIGMYGKRSVRAIARAGPVEE